LDEYHRRLYCAMDNAVRTVDLKCWPKNSLRTRAVDLRLRFFARYGGRSNDKQSDFKVRFRGDIALPGLVRKLHLVLDNAGQDSCRARSDEEGVRSSVGDHHHVR
jgi:hypothetical protein